MTRRTSAGLSDWRTGALYGKTMGASLVERWTVVRSRVSDSCWLAVQGDYEVGGFGTFDTFAEAIFYADRRARE